ncbi:hypothetical protein HN371_28020 [Candidatus Poribacteria bacterium]|jgi:hypothetical protein|nr:hypothetical protein [Candidatus Poribacteria bacterium]MBT5537245.1 hypothetical protein [Candidatus Poribacteria bacterium]MBT5715243.1 hypothetical protein [Candidatus Poribacteria bacterium]MBT7100782.1 hypothetical protein [Candidatus Poribacteria bacterium]MBT7805539.1 hypothetical protein [Candidatus Poribacteria bacterium]
MTAQERILAALEGDGADRVPFTCYTGLLPEAERPPLLRDGRLGLVQRQRLYTVEQPDVRSEREEYSRGRERLARHTLHTPVGSVSETLRLGGGYGTSLRCEFLIKQPEDYEVVEYIVKNTVYTPDYEGFLAAQERLGSQGIVVGNLKYTPAQEMLVLLMGPERYGLDYSERRDLFDGLHDAIAERDRELYRIAAESPAEYVIYGDNTTSEMVGLERFEKYCVPRYNEAAAMLHARGKKLGVHMDGNLRILREAIAGTDIDFIEAFTPYPMSDMTVAEARAAWPDKALWVNFTSGVHIAGPEAIREHTAELLRQAAPGGGFLLGITEDAPADIRPDSLSVIADTVRQLGALPLG